MQRIAQIMHGAPVRHDPAFVSPIALQHLIEQVIVATGIGLVDLVISAHHGAWLSTLNRDLKGEQIAFSRGGIADVGTRHHAPGFLAVKRKMFHRRDHVHRLNAADCRSSH